MTERAGDLPGAVELLSAPEDPVQVLGMFSGTEYLEERQYTLGRIEPEAAQGLGVTVMLDNRASTFALRAAIELPDDLLQDGSAEAAFALLAGNMAGHDKPYTLRDRILFNGERRTAPTDNAVTLMSATDQAAGQIFVYTKQNHVMGLVGGISSADHLKHGEHSRSDATRALGKTVADVLNTLQAMRGFESEALVSLSIDIPEDYEPPAPQPEVTAAQPGTALVRVEREPQPAYLKMLEGYPSFNEFGGLDNEIAILKRAGRMLHASPELLNAYGLKHPGGVLLQGPGGVGKTTLVQAWAKHMKAEFREVAIDEILSRYVGESTQNLRKKYESANAAGHEVVLCFNEFDGLFSQQASGNEGVAKSMVALYKTILEDPGRYPNVITAATANSLDGFDPNLLRPGRFGFVIPIGLPNEKARTEIFSVYLYRRPEHFEVLSSDDIASMITEAPRAGADQNGMIDIPALVAMTSDWTGDDIKHVVESTLWDNLMEEEDTGVRPARIAHQRLVGAIRYHREHRPSGADPH
jgi:DNA polymerase III delta prime subunit